MSLFKNLFQNFNSKETDVQQESTEMKKETEGDHLNPNMERFKQIFVEEKLPTQNEKKNSENFSLKENPSLLKEFLSQDFEKQGYDDGYHYQSIDLMNKKVEDYINDYELIVEKELERSRHQLYTFKNHLIKCGNEDMPELEDQLSLRCITIEEDISKLKTELDLSSNLQGLVRGVISQYKTGYQKGMSNYMETRMLGSYTGLFN